MSFVLLILVKVSICATILVYGSLIAECSLISGVFTKSLSMYHKQSLIYITKTFSLSVVVLFYDLMIVTPDDISLIRALKILIIQAFFSTIGFSFLKQSVKKTSFVRNMKNNFTQLKVLEKQNTPQKSSNMEVFAGRVH